MLNFEVDSLEVLFHFSQDLMQSLQSHYTASSESSGTRLLIADYIHYRLDNREQLNSLPLKSDMVRHTLREMGTEFERRFQQTFEEIVGKLDKDRTNISSTFNQVADDVFKDGINWGRIVAFISCGAIIAGRPTEHCSFENVDYLIDWMTEYIDKNLLSWIKSQGGWVSWFEKVKK